MRALDGGLPNLADWNFCGCEWYHRIETLNTGWGARKLDRVRFPPVTRWRFGFVDPSDVLRWRHIIPASPRKVHVDGRGCPVCARDSSDWGCILCKSVGTLKALAQIMAEQFDSFVDREY